MSLQATLRPGTALFLGISFLCTLLCAPGALAGVVLPAVSQTQASEPQGSDLGAQESALRKSARQTPNDPRVLARLGTVLAMQGKLQESVTWLEKAQKFDPGNADTRRTLATSYWQLGQLEKSRENLELVLRAKPQDGWSSLLLGMVSEDLGDHARAVRLLSGVLPRVRQRSEPILALARAYYQLKDKDKARETLRYLSDLPEDSKGAFAAGRVAAEFRDYETAEGLFRSIQYTYPEPAELQLNIALAQYGERRYDDSQKTLLALVQSGRANANAYELLGWTYQQQDHLDEMMQAFEKAINIEPAQESHFLELGQALLEKRNSETALEVAKEAVKRFPSSSRAASLKGSAELHMSRLTEAVESYKKAVELDPKDPKAMLGLALTYWNANQDAEAAKVFADGASKFPNDSLLQLKYAIFLINAPEEKTPEREAQIEKLLKRSEELDDSMAETHFHLGNVAIRQNKYEEALRQFAAAAELDPEMSKAHFALARVYRRLGREPDAARETEIHAKLKAKEEQNSEANAGIGTRHP